MVEPRPSRGPIRPAGATKPAAALVAVSFALLAIAKTTGSGWLVVVLALVGAIGALSVVLPIAGLVGVELAVRLPADATVGRPVDATLGATRLRQPIVVRLVDPIPGGPVVCLPSDEGRIEAVPARRGVAETVELDVRCGAPLGLFWWRRRLVVALERPTDVAPVPSVISPPSPGGTGADGSEARSRRRRGHDLVRGVRAYEPGDPPKAIHWTASARHGDLLVKEWESASGPPVTIVVDLGPTDGADAEKVASWAFGAATAALDAGLPVELVTLERSGVVSGSVATPTDAGRRLARAVCGMPPDAPGRPAHELHRRGSALRSGTATLSRRGDVVRVDRSSISGLPLGADHDGSGAS